MPSRRAETAMRAVVCEMALERLEHRYERLAAALRDLAGPRTWIEIQDWTGLSEARCKTIRNLATAVGGKE